MEGSWLAEPVTRSTFIAVKIIYGQVNEYRILGTFMTGRDSRRLQLAQSRPRSTADLGTPLFQHLAQMRLNIWMSTKADFKPHQSALILLIISDTR